jgi:phosphocarrier protein
LAQPGVEAMSGETLQRKVTISNPMGLHFRPAAEFARRAAEFQCTVTVALGDKRANGKVFLELIMLAAEQGTELMIEASGRDARSALDVLIDVLTTIFREDEGPDEAALPPKG